LEEFLQEIARPDPVNMGAISHPGQRSHKWEPEEVFFQLLVSCSRPYVFDRYLASCLEYLQEKSAALDLF
ncbi:MAG TPA: hypothetical protein VFP46_00790, partial [Candidatus Paceibacterota bacterium]|nr:hypothetical protein [Candidatus Paceibacterota bacterium]